MKIDFAKMIGAEVQIDYDKLSVHGIDVHAQYRRLPSEMAFSLSYVTRATFLDYNWDIDMAMELRNFRNMVVWGRSWQGEKLWQLDKKERLTENGMPVDIYSVEKLMDHTCPRCQSKMIWGNALPVSLLDLTDNIDLGAGFRTIIDRSPPDRLTGMKHKHSLVHRALSLGARHDRTVKYPDVCPVENIANIRSKRYRPDCVRPVKIYQSG